LSRFSTLLLISAPVFVTYMGLLTTFPMKMGYPL